LGKSYKEIDDQANRSVTMPMDGLHVILEGAGNAESSKTAQNRDKGSIGENGADSRIAIKGDSLLLLLFYEDAHLEYMGFQ
jgi:hypothetical protein